MQIDVLKIIDELREKTLKTYSGGAKLVVVQVGDNSASNLYVSSKQKELPKWNVEVELVKLTENVTESNVIELIKRLNFESNVNGIIVQLPLPKHINEQKVINAISSVKNVDGFNQVLPNGSVLKSKFESCTPKGIMHIIKHETNISGEVVTLIGRGKTIGQPLMEMLSKEPCTLICCNSHTQYWQRNQALGISDIVISAVGEAGFLSGCVLKFGALVIDAGISRVNGKQVGDLTHDSFLQEDGINYTPWTNGVGKMTVAMLAVNTIEAYQMQTGKLNED